MILYFLAALRRGGAAGAGLPACSACRMAISVNMTGRSPFAARTNISAAVCRSVRSCTASGNAVA